MRAIDVVADLVSEPPYFQIWLRLVKQLHVTIKEVLVVAHLNIVRRLTLFLL